MSPLRVVVVVVAVVSAASCGCGGNPPGNDGGTNCAIGQSSCDGQCVDTTTNAQNCGACARACTTGQSCIGGTCYAASCTDVPFTGVSAFALMSESAALLGAGGALLLLVLALWAPTRNLAPLPALQPPRTALPSLPPLFLQGDMGTG